MKIKNLREERFKIFKKAQEEKRAIFQFNFCDFSQLKGIINAAKRFPYPFILGTSEGESKYLGLETAVFLKKEAEKELKRSLILNLDHGKSLNYLKKAIETGYDMIHFDGSKLSLEKNIELSKEIINYAKKRGVIIEGEIGVIRGSSKVHKENVKIFQKDLSSPEEIERFIKEVDLDLLAVSIGNIHGIAQKIPSLDFKRLSIIKNITRERGVLVLHGGSGIPISQIKKAIQKGIVKINLNTEIRLAWQQGWKKAFKKYPDEISPYKLAPIAIKEIERIVKKYIKL